ncbi:MAG: hypothetical protein FWG32_02275 [Oscillospiraceae bacterium]|nr:hypothetical protein [Oscillospiraceae bacterium]
MAKYEKLIIQRTLEPYEKGQRVWFKGEHDFDGKDFGIAFIVIDHDLVMESAAHTHDFDMYVWHFPMDPGNMDDLGGEVIYGLGAGTEDDPAETYTITKAGCVFVPAGTYHGPHIFKNITKPILFVHAIQKGEYYKS